jgi:hypothetical protein
VRFSHVVVVREEIVDMFKRNFCQNSGLYFSSNLAKNGFFSPGRNAMKQGISLLPQMIDASTKTKLYKARY